MEMNELLSVADAASELEVHRTRINQLIDTGLLPAQRIGRAYVIRRGDLALVKDRPSPGRPKKAEAEAQPVGAAELKQPQQLVAGAAGQGAANGGAQAEAKPKAKRTKKGAKR